MHIRVPFFAFALLVAAPSSSFASSACDCGFASDPLGVDHDAVPTNLKLFIEKGTDRPGLSLTKTMSGAPQDIPFHFEEATGGTGDAWMVPDMPLEPNTMYEWGRGELRVSFTTGAGADTEAPTFTSAALEARAIDGACPEHLAAALSVVGAGDNTATPSQLTWKITLKSPAKTLYLPPGDNGYIGRMLTDEAGWDTCLSNVVEAEEDKTYEASLVALDWAGNATQEVSTSFQFSTGGSSGCGCRAAGGAAPGAAGAFFLAAAALFVSRRRRR
jgi:MYXO-CTERM domain-containing protein